MADQSVSSRVRSLLEPVLAQDGIEVFDVEQHANVLKVTVDRPGGVDLETISQVTRTVSDQLDRTDVIAGRYLLEVSSPGVERPLRTPTHFAGAVGCEVVVKTVPGSDGERRIEGTLEAADDAGITVNGRQISHNDIQSARTRFVWPAKSKAGKS